MFEGNIKGTHIINVIQFVKKKRGKLGLIQLFEEINKERQAHELLDENSFVEKEWYPYEHYLEFLTIADTVTGNGDLSRCYEMGNQTLKNLGHLSYLARAPNVHDFMKSAQENWARVYDFGKVKVVKEKDNTVVMQYHGFPESRAKCEYYKGSLAGMLELCNLEGEVKETACNTEDSEYCEFTITWK